MPRSLTFYFPARHEGELLKNIILEKYIFVILYYIIIIAIAYIINGTIYNENLFVVFELNLLYFINKKKRKINNRLCILVDISRHRKRKKVDAPL